MSFYSVLKSELEPSGQAREAFEITNSREPYDECVSIIEGIFKEEEYKNEVTEEGAGKKWRSASKTRIVDFSVRLKLFLTTDDSDIHSWFLKYEPSIAKS